MVLYLVIFLCAGIYGYNIASMLHFPAWAVIITIFFTSVMAVQLARALQRPKQ
ncbi:MAG: hypothetical protein RLZZ156_1305 [Deinococcota bacterium]|jgi:predicted ABC-type exoprotein transport system permease subunit